MSDISSQATEIIFMSSIGICFGLSWTYLWKTKEITAPASTAFFLILQVIIVVALIIYYCLYKFAKLDDKIFNWAIVGTGLGAIFLFILAFIAGWAANKGKILKSSSLQGNLGF
jgi:hypothetical protein